MTAKSERYYGHRRNASWNAYDPWSAREDVRKEQQAINVGHMYMTGMKSVEEVYHYLNHTDHYPLGRSHVEMAIRHGAQAEIDYGQPQRSRVQPEQLTCPFDWKKVRRQLRKQEKEQHGDNDKT